MPLRLLTFIALLLPTLYLSYQFIFNKLGANPVEALTHQTGKWALISLLLSLSITPTIRFTRYKKLMLIRRTTGLYAFYYASLHLLIYAVFDQSLSLQFLWEDVIDRPYITLGFSAWLMLIPLTVSSTQNMRRRMGKRWVQLHKLVYVIAIVVIFHYLWLIRVDYTEVVPYALWLVILLGYRLAKLIPKWAKP